jgi:hypothetical protein
MKVKMNKFNILFESIMRDMLEIDWQSNDEFDVKVLFNPNEDPYDQSFYIQMGNSEIKLLKNFDSEEAEWIAKMVIDELKAGMDFNSAVKKWYDIRKEQKISSNC